MKKFALSVLTIASISSYAPLVWAEENQDHDEGRIEHYQGQAVASNAEAIESLKSHNAKIAEILETETLSEEKLEKIHEISYSLETAIDFLIAEKQHAEAKLGAVDEAVQAIHNNSENHQEPAVREWFAKLEASVAALESEDAAPHEIKTEFEITIKDHKFTPDEIYAPAG